MRRLLLLILLAGCVAPRPALDETARRLALAATPEARAAEASARLADAGTAPLGDGRVRPLPTDIRWAADAEGAAGLVPGQDPVLRTELVTLAVALDSPWAAEVIETARALVAQRPHTSPRRSVLIALWPPGGNASAGVAAVQAMPVWLDSLRGPVLVVGADAPGAETVATGADAGATLVARLARRVLDVADAPPPDTVAAR